MNTFFRDTLTSIRRGLAGVMGIAPVRRYVESPQESFQIVADEVRRTTISAVDRQSRRTSYQWHREPDGSMTAPALDRDRVVLLKKDPEEYFKDSREWRTIGGNDDV